MSFEHVIGVAFFIRSFTTLGPVDVIVAADSSRIWTGVASPAGAATSGFGTEVPLIVAWFVNSSSAEVGLELPASKYRRMSAW